MAKIDGNYMRFKIGTVLVASTNSCKFAFKKAIQETTTQDSGGWKEQHPTAGVRECSGSFDGAYDTNGSLAVDDIISMIISNQNQVSASWGETATGGVYYSGTINISDCSVDAKNDTIPTFSGNWVSSGAVVMHTVGGS